MSSDVKGIILVMVVWVLQEEHASTLVTSSEDQTAILQAPTENAEVILKGRLLCLAIISLFVLYLFFFYKYSTRRYRSKLTTITLITNYKEN